MNYTFFITLLLMLPVVFIVLNGIQITKIFKKGKTFEILCTYVILCVIISGLFAIVTDKFLSFIFEIIFN